MYNKYFNEFDKVQILDKMNDLEIKLDEEHSKEVSQRSRDKEFELIYARMIAGLKLNTGYRLF